MDAKRLDSRIKFMNIEIDNLTMKEAIISIEELIKANNKSYVVTPNVDHIVQLEKDSLLQEIYANANLILADGMPLIWISKLYGTRLKEKISGSDLFPKICGLAARNNYRIFFLGATEGVAKKAAQKLKIAYPNLNVVGTYSPPFDFESNRLEQKRIINMVNSSKPHILIVCMGSPKQEKFIYQNRNQLEVPISLGLGASFDFVAGNVKRAPKFISNMGFEWLWRTALDPRRLAKRYIKDAIKIIPIFIKYWKKNRKKSS